MTLTPARYILAAALVGTLAVAPTGALAQAKPPAQGDATPSKTLTIDPAEIQKPWTGDLDAGTDGVQQNLLYDRQGCPARRGLRRRSPVRGGPPGDAIAVRVGGSPELAFGWTSQWGPTS